MYKYYKIKNLNVVENLKYFLVLNNVKSKIKFTIIDDEQHTILTLTLGMISNYMGQKKNLRKDPIKHLWHFSILLKGWWYGF